MNITGIHHIELTVTDLKRSAEFYRSLPGFELVAEYPDFAMYSIGKNYLGLTSHSGDRKTNEFSEFSVGLDHLSFEVERYEDLEEAIAFFNGQKITHGEIKSLSNSTYVVAFRDPDNIQLELAWRGKHD